MTATNPDGDGPLGAWDSDWSPDGKQLVFGYGGDDPPGDIAVVNRAGTYFRNLTRHFDQRAGYPAWSPDGTKIVFLVFADGRYRVFTMNADGSRIEPLLGLRFGEYVTPDWGPRP